MSLVEQINKDMTNAMKEQDKFKLSVIRMLKSALLVEKTKHDKNYELSDQEVLSIVKHQVKMRKDSMNEYEKYNALDKVENLQKEVEILNNYLPEELSEEELNNILDSVFSDLQPNSIKDMGRVMKEATTRCANRADGQMISNLVKERLNKIN